MYIYAYREGGARQVTLKHTQACAYSYYEDTFIVVLKLHTKCVCVCVCVCIRRLHLRLLVL
jgi:hypothetical protein